MFNLCEQLAEIQVNGMFMGLLYDNAATRGFYIAAAARATYVVRGIK